MDIHSSICTAKHKKNIHGSRQIATVMELQTQTECKTQRQKSAGTIIINTVKKGKGYTSVNAAIATPLGKCPKLRSVSLARCSLTDEAKDHIAKIISLHGVLEHEAIWSSSLREEVVPAPSMPQLMMNLSHNDLGDETAKSICDALYNDKWLLGLNLESNNLSQQGTRRFAETLMKNNQTLAVLSLANMKNPVETSTLNTFNSLLHDRDRFLQQVATESREKRMALGSLLLEWGVEKNKMVEICYVESPGRAASAKSISTTSGKIVSEPSNVRNGCVYRSRTTVSSDAGRVSQHPDSNDISNNDNTEDEDDRKYDTIGDSSANNHVKTVRGCINC